MEERNERKMSVKTIVAIGIGSAVCYFRSIRCNSTGIPNTNLETSYPFLALMSVVLDQ